MRLIVTETGDSARLSRPFFNDCSKICANNWQSHLTRGGLRVIVFARFSSRNKELWSGGVASNFAAFPARIEV